MIGGQVIIPIRDRSGKKIELSTTAQNIKLGTFDKIKRAIELQKEIVFEDINLLGVYKISSFSTPIMSTTYSGADYFVITIAFKATSGSDTSVGTGYVYISSNDTARCNLA